MLSGGAITALHCGGGRVQPSTNNTSNFLSPHSPLEHFHFLLTQSKIGRMALKGSRAEILKGVDLGFWDWEIESVESLFIAPFNKWILINMSFKRH